MTDAGDGGGFIETYTGHQFYPFDPQPDAVRLADIAGGLAHTCRFGGHCKHFYSVAQHSLLVGRELSDHPPRIRAYGLLHDAAEAYLGDIPRPIKDEFGAVERAEERILAAVWTAFDLPPPSPAEWSVVTTADDRLLAYEASELLSDGSWAGDPPDLAYDLRGATPETVRDRFQTSVQAVLDEISGIHD